MFFVGISFLHCCGKLEFRVTFTLNRILSRIPDVDMIDYLETLKTFLRGFLGYSFFNCMNFDQHTDL